MFAQLRCCLASLCPHKRLTTPAAAAQEADNSGRSVELSVIPRLDLNPVFFTEAGGGGEFTLGNTSLYSLFEGNITDNLSFSVANHWAGFDSVHDVFATTKDLYAYTLRSDSTNWLDWAYLTYSVGNFAFTLGKDIITTGGLEFDDYDFEVHPSLVSSYWQNLAPRPKGTPSASSSPLPRTASVPSPAASSTTPWNGGANTARWRPSGAPPPWGWTRVSSSLSSPWVSA